MFRCMICKKERKLTKDELLEMGKYIENKNLKAVDYLNKISLDDGYTCENEKKHKYEFLESFDKEVHALSADIADKNTERKNTIETLSKIENSIRALMEESKKKNERLKEIDNECLKLVETLEEMTGNTKFEIWE